MNAIKIGDIVKSYDFPGQTDYYVVGQVAGIGPVKELGSVVRYHIRIIARVWDIDATISTVESYCYPPINGTETLGGDVASGVEVFWG